MMMREMEKEEEEEEEVSLSHFIHAHPLTLIESDKGKRCYGCGIFFMGGAVYGCKKCGNKRILHQDCGEMPREIKHPMHPNHTLVQKKGDRSQNCAVCEVKIKRIGYFCTCSGCEFQMHLRCTPTVGVENVGDEQICIKHPSHPQHQLFLLRKRHTFMCDACGSMETGRSYGCLPCQYWIHERCAALPTNFHDHPLHHHPLSLAFDLSPGYYKFAYNCDVCRKHLPLNRWMYHCQICRYVVHIKCAIKPPPLPNASSDNAVDAEGVIQFPSRHFPEEVIKPFVIREGGEMSMPRDDQKYMFSTHRHQLSLVSLSTSEVKDDDDDDLDSCGQISELICDACITPISSSSSSSSSSYSSSSLDYNKYYMSCGECKYFLHLACFHLPPKLSSHPFHKPDHHTLMLIACPKLYFRMKCSICNLPMNGLIYSCTRCSFKADIKCASLPNTIKHEAHPQHHLHSKFWSKEEYIKDIRRVLCSGCHFGINWGLVYICGSCDFTLCLDCVMLPPVNKHEYDGHPVPLRYDAHLNHPDDFCCDACEQEINPKKWMYHCRICDTSFHPKCFPATSGEFRNIKFGNQYSVDPGLHPHPLTFQLLATKLRCDVCRRRVYGEAGVDQRGFHCSSCNFFMCFSGCGYLRVGGITLIDKKEILAIDLLF